MGDYGVQTSNRFAALDLEAERPKRAAPKAIESTKPKPKPKQPATTPASALFPAVGAALPTRDARANKKAGPKGNKDHADKGPKAVKAIGGGEKKRVFDKYSHSGKGQVPKDGKKHGGGRHNWGNAGDSERAALTPDDKVIPEEKEEKEAPAAEGEETPAAPDEAPQKTYEEFLAEQAAEQRRLKKEAARALRQAGEGEDGTAWAEYQRRKGEGVSTGFVVRAKKAKKAATPAAAAPSATRTEQRVGADKIFIITPAGDNAKRGRGGRGGRGARSDRPERSDEARAASSSSSAAAPAR